MSYTNQATKQQISFSSLKTTLRLQELAKTPFDLRLEGNLTAQRVQDFVAESCGLHCLYATERVTLEVMQTLQALADEANAVHKMERMQAGDVINKIEGYPSENRAVLHTALRDFFDHPNESEAAKDAAKLAKAEIDKLQKFIEKIDQEKKFTDIVLVAIGGSELGPKAIYLALEHLKKNNRTAHFIGNVDPDDTAQVLGGLDLKKCLVAIVSKSGTTLETTTNEELVKDYFVKAKLDPKEHFIAITGKGSPLDDPQKYLESFYMWDWVGGRYSASSMVGGVLLAFTLGFDVYWEFLKGAHAMDQAALNKDYHKNLPLLGALLSIWNRNFLHIQTQALIPYSRALWRFPAHIQQVEMESNGKEIDRFGNFVDFDTSPIFWGEAGTNAQHSFYQMIHQGTTPVALELIGFKESQQGKDILYENTSSQQKLVANLIAQSIALATGQKKDNPNKFFPGNRPSHIILGKKLTPYTLGSLFAYFENRAAFEGFIWNINSFDQEGVQLGKVLAERILDRIAIKNGKKPKNMEPYLLADAYLNQLDDVL